MIEVLEANPITGRRVQIATADTLTEAKDKVAAMGVVFMEDDADYPDCADAFLTDGRVVAIQPVGFKIAA